MNQPNKRHRSKANSLGWTVVMVLILVVLSVVQSQRKQPNDQTALIQNKNSVLNSDVPREQKVLSSEEVHQQTDLEKNERLQQSGRKQDKDPNTAKSKRGLVPSLPAVKKQTPANSNRPPPVGSTQRSTTAKPKPEPGQLRDLGGKVWESVAGLKYGPGSLEKHRLLHVMRHSKDQPDRPGKHGVFAGEGERKRVLALIDEAYFKALKGGKNVKIKKEGGRIIYTVNMGRRIGFVGGQTGNKKGRPGAYKIRLVLEGTNVITAFPL